MEAVSEEGLSACAICGESVSPADLAPELARVPQTARLTIHARCFHAYLEHSRRRGEAWARSPRGRRTLLWLRLKTGAMLASAALVTVVAAGPMAAMLALRGWRLARAVRSNLLGSARGVVIVGYRANRERTSDAYDAVAEWPQELGVAVVTVDIDAPFSKTDLARAAWEHWGSAGKSPRMPSIVVVPKRGAIQCVRFRGAVAGAADPLKNPLVEARAAVESHLSNADARG